MKARALLVVTGLCLAGCAAAPGPRDANRLEPAAASLPHPRVVRSPAAVAVFYSQEFMQQPVVDRSVPSISHRPGTASVALFDQALDAGFERVVRLAAWPLPAGATHPEVAAVFVPRILGIATVQSASSSARLIDYRIDVYTPQGKRIDTWTLYARGRADGATSAREEKLYALALRDAAAQLLTSMSARPALKARFPAAPAAQPSRPLPAARDGRLRLAIASPLESAEGRETASEVACIAEALKQTNPDASLIPLEQIQDQMFPWFEHANLVDTGQRMLELMREQPVREGLQAAGLDYLAFLRFERSSERNPEAIRCDTTYKAPGCSGVRADALKTKIQVTLWNLKRYTMSARFETESAGSATFSGVAVPLAGERSSPGSACGRAADAIGRLVSAR